MTFALGWEIPARRRRRVPLVNVAEGGERTVSCEEAALLHEPTGFCARTRTGST